MGVFEQFPYTNFHDLNLDWVLTKMKEMLSTVGSYTTKVDNIELKVEGLEDEIQIINMEIDNINKELEKVKNGDYVELYLCSIINWIDNNLQELVAKIVKYVAFEIDDSGYFIANIPFSWKFLQFDTIMDIDNEKYGHLTMQW